MASSTPRPVPGAISQGRNSNGRRAPHGPCVCGFLTGGHPGHTDIQLDTLLKALEDIKHGIADLLDLIALPRNREQHLSPPAATCTCGDVQADMPPVIQYSAAPPTAPLRHDAALIVTSQSRAAGM